MTRYKPEGSLIGTPENRNSLSNIDNIRAAFRERRILEGKAILCDSEHNLIVDMGCMKGVMKRVECGIGILEGTTRDIAIISRVNKPVSFVITSLSERGGGEIYAELSRKAVQEMCVLEYIANLRAGDIIDARVTHLEPFGAFVDIGAGISSMISIDSISVSRISHPRDRFTIGTDIKAVVKSKEIGGRINLSHKELLGSWVENAALFLPGETVCGIVRSIEEYGIFVELTPNLAGLAELKDGVLAGQHTSVYIKSLIPEKMKVKLIIVDSFESDCEPSPPSYYITRGRIDRWQYSPPCAEKLIESVFV